MTLGFDLKALDVMNNSGLWLRRTTPSHELKALDAMIKLGLLDDMNDSEL